MQKLLWLGHFPGDPKHKMIFIEVSSPSQDKGSEEQEETSSDLDERTETWDFVLGKLKKNKEVKLFLLLNNE